MPLKISTKLLKHFAGFCFPSDTILLFVHIKCRFSLSCRDLEEISTMRGLKIDHSTISRWVIRFVPLLDQEIRKRKKPTGSSWRMDETYIKIKGRWFYLYRAVDSAGQTINFLL